MNNEKEIEEMAKVLFESGVALDATDFAFGVDGDDHFTRLAIKLVNANYGNVEKAVKEFAKRIKYFINSNTAIGCLQRDNEEEFVVEFSCTPYAMLEFIDNLITEIYGVDE